MFYLSSYRYALATFYFSPTSSLFSAHAFVVGDVEESSILYQNKTLINSSEDKVKVLCNKMKKELSSVELSQVTRFSYNITQILNITPYDILSNKVCNTFPKMTHCRTFLFSNF